MEKMLEEGRALELYLESEQSDKDTDSLDDLWQSIYDVYKLVLLGIIEGDVEDEAMVEAKSWLVETQSHTDAYKGFEL